MADRDCPVCHGTGEDRRVHGEWLVCTECDAADREYRETKPEPLGEEMIERITQRVVRDPVQYAVRGVAYPDPQGPFVAADEYARLAARTAELERELQDHREVLEDKRRLARELDVAMHGEAGAAKQASLCDLIGPAKKLRAEVEALNARVADMERELDNAWIAAKNAAQERHVLECERDAARALLAKGGR